MGGHPLGPSTQKPPLEFRTGPSASAFSPAGVVRMATAINVTQKAFDDNPTVLRIPTLGEAEAAVLDAIAEYSGSGPHGAISMKLQKRGYVAAEIQAALNSLVQQGVVEITGNSIRRKQ